MRNAHTHAQQSAAQSAHTPHITHTYIYTMRMRALCAVSLSPIARALALAPRVRSIGVASLCLLAGLALYAMRARHMDNLFYLLSLSVRAFLRIASPRSKSSTCTCVCARAPEMCMCALQPTRFDDDDNGDDHVFNIAAFHAHRVYRSAYRWIYKKLQIYLLVDTQFYRETNECKRVTKSRSLPCAPCSLILSPKLRSQFRAAHIFSLCECNQPDVCGSRLT